MKDHANQLKRALRADMDMKQICRFNVEMRNEWIYSMLCHKWDRDMMINKIIRSWMKIGIRLCTWDMKV